MEINQYINYFHIGENAYEKTVKSHLSVNRLDCYENEYDTSIKGIQTRLIYSNSKHNFLNCAASKWAFNLLLKFRD